MPPIKKPQSAYFQFSAEKRKEIATSNPGLRVGEVQKLITSQWKLLSDEQKQVYIDLAAKDKERYEREKQENPVDESELVQDNAKDNAANGNTCIYPLGRVKRIVQSDPDVNKVSREALVAIAKASELFAQFLATKSYEQTLFNNKRQIKASDVTRAIHITSVLDWLRDDFTDVRTATTSAKPTAAATPLADDDSSSSKPKPSASDISAAFFGARHQRDLAEASVQEGGADSVEEELLMDES